MDPSLPTETTTTDQVVTLIRSGLSYREVEDRTGIPRSKVGSIALKRIPKEERERLNQGKIGKQVEGLRKHQDSFPGGKLARSPLAVKVPQEVLDAAKRIPNSQQYLREVIGSALVKDGYLKQGD